MSIQVTSINRDYRPEINVDFVFVTVAELLPADTYVAVNEVKVGAQHIYVGADGSNGKTIGFGPPEGWTYGEPFSLINSEETVVVEGYAS